MVSSRKASERFEKTPSRSTIREDVCELFARCQPGHPERKATLGHEDAPSRPHMFWILFNRIAVRHAIRRDDVIEAVAAEKRARKAAAVGSSLLRDGWREMLEECNAHDIPVVIVSAGLSDVIMAMHEADNISLPPSSVVLANECAKLWATSAVIPHETCRYCSCCSRVRARCRQAGVRQRGALRGCPTERPARLAPREARTAPAADVSGV